MPDTLSSTLSERLAERDLIDVSTVQVLNVTDGKEDSRRLFWTPPADSNGPVLGYRAKLYRDDVDTVGVRWLSLNSSPFRRPSSSA